MDAVSLETLVREWHAGTLPAKEWTHAAHVAVTGYFAFDRDEEAVFREMKAGVIFFNATKGGVNGPDSGYHETRTRFWTLTITAAIRAEAPESALAAARCAVARFGEDRELPSLHYSFAVAHDRRARREWVSPDRV